MEVKLGYKQAEAGVIPEDWESTTVREIASPIRNAIVGGPFGSDLVSTDYVEEGVPVIRGQNMGTKHVSGSFVFVTQAKANSLEANLARPGDLVLTQRGTLGQVSLVPDRPYDRYLISQSQMKLTVNRKVADQNFFYYVFSSPEQQKVIRENTIQTGVPHINLGILRSISVQRPPLAEQQAIAEALSDADALIESLEQLIVKKRQIKQGAMQELLTGKRRLPGFGGEWRVKKIADLAVLSKAGVNPAATPNVIFTHFSLPAFDAGAMPIVEYGSLIGSNKFLVPSNAVLVSKLNPRIPRVWAPSHIPDNAVCSTEFLVLVPREGTDRDFLSALCWSPAVCYQMELHATGTTGSHQRIPPSQALAIEVSTPDNKAEQAAIAAILSDMDAGIAALEDKLAKARQIKQGMMQELLTGKVRLT